MRPHQLQVVTPEAVVLNLPTAALASRFVARGLDVLIQAAALFLLLLGLGFVASVSGVNGNGAVGVAILVVVLLVGTTIWLGYPIVFESLWRGRTPGKAAMGLRVVTTEGAPIRFRHALVRGVLGLVDVWLSGGSVGVLTILVSRNEQRFGDMAAGTIVVRERSGAVAPAAAVFAPPPGCEEYVAHLDVSGIGAPEYEAARSFLLRAGTLAPSARFDLAARLASPMVERIGQRPPSWMGPELWLACLAAAYQRRHGSPTYAGSGVAPGGYGYGGGYYPGGGYAMPAPTPAPTPAGYPAQADQRPRTDRAVPGEEFVPPG